MNEEMSTEDLYTYKLKTIVRYYEHTIDMINTKLDILLDKVIKKDGSLDKNELLNGIGSIQEFIRNDIKLKEKE